MIIRVHWITYLILSLQIIAIIIFSITLLEVFKAKPIVFLSITITWLISSIFLYIEWLNYELDRLIITNNRII
ncbi:MAG: hypothetical protein LBC61_02820 [Candidatus Peribacteria bacterium]|nr:hypothetical protein [Candidatus Peribacteria bacterium]